MISIAASCLIDRVGKRLAVQDQEPFVSVRWNETGNLIADGVHQRSAAVGTPFVHQPAGGWITTPYCSAIAAMVSIAGMCRLCFPSSSKAVNMRSRPLP